MAKQGHIGINEILCYIQGIRNTATVREIHEAGISLFNMQKLHDALLQYHEHRVKGLILRARTPEKHIKCILDWMLENKGDTGIPHFVADNISWWLYPVGPKKINCAMLLRENKSLAPAILDLGEQIQKMKQMLRDFCQNYIPINNLQSEVESRIYQFLADTRNVSNSGSAETLQSAAASPSQRSLSISAEGPIYPYTQPPHTLAPSNPAEPTHPSTPPPLHTALPLPSTGSINPPSPSQLLPTPSSPTFESVLGGRADKPQSEPAVQNEEADFTVVDRKKK